MLNALFFATLCPDSEDIGAIEVIYYFYCLELAQIMVSDLVRVCLIGS